MVAAREVERGRRRGAVLRHLGHAHARLPRLVPLLRHLQRLVRGDGLDPGLVVGFGQILVILVQILKKNTQKSTFFNVGT